MGVLSINQNVTLPLDAVNLEKDRHQLMDMVAFNQESKECMKKQCVFSPSIKTLHFFLTLSI